MRVGRTEQPQISGSRTADGAVVTGPEMRERGQRQLKWRVGKLRFPQT